MSLSQTVLGVAILLLSTGMLLIFRRPNKKRSPVALREIPAILGLRRMLGAAVEQGTRVHFGLGRGAIGSPDYGSTFATFDSLESITRFSLLADQLPVITSGDGTTSLLGEDTVRGVYRQEAAADKIPADCSRLTGVTPFAYAGGAIPVIASPDTSANILTGHFGVESGLMTTGNEANPSSTFGASDSIPAQSIFFNASENTLFGEELFALPAYLEQKPSLTASLLVQDLLRLVLVFGMILGAILVVAGIL